MTRLELEIHDDALAAINKIKNLNDSGIELIIPEGSVLFDNIISLKLISQLAEKTQKTIQFTTADPAGAALIGMLEEPVGQAEVPYAAREMLQETPPAHQKKNLFKAPALPKIKLPKINKGLFIPLLIVAAIFLAVFFISKKPIASAKIVLNSQPLTRSNTIRVKEGVASSQEKMELKGQTVTTSVEITDEVAATGEKLVGKKAKGKATIYNKTDSDIELEKGSELNYDEKDLVFVLDDDVTVPAREEQVNPDDPGTQIFKLGEADVEIVAGDIGENYNLDSGEDLEVDGYKSSEMTAKTKDDLSGGESKKVTMVSETDKTTLQKKVSDAALKKATEDLKFKMGKTQKLVDGSVTTLVTKETYSANVGDEADKLMLTVYASATGLTYLESELNSLLDKLVQSFVPDGYVLSEKQREVTATPLGKSSSSVLSSTEADLQVTLKTFMVTKVDKDELKKSLAGKSVKDAEKILGSINNINTYSITISPSIPFFNNVPKDLNRINIDVENE